jgi:hypothetical protein
MGTKSREVIWSGRIMATKMRAQEARQRAQEALREADRAEADGGLRWPRAAVADHCAMPQRRNWMARGRVCSLQDASEPSARCDPPTARYANLEARGLAEMPVLQEGALCAACAHDQVDRDAGDHALQMGASGRGAVSADDAALPL